MASLINVGLQKNIRTQLHKFISETEIAEINACLSSYTDYPGGLPLLLATNVFKARRPNRNLRSFPAVTMYSNERNSEWIASRTTEDTVSITIFCCLTYTENEYLDEVMEVFSEAVFSALMKHPKFDFTITEDNVDVVYGVFDSKPNSIKFGSLDEGHIRAGEIQWTGRLYLHQSQSYT